MLLSVCVLACLGAASAFLSYQSQIPNGNSVISPCLIGYWSGVGHLNSHGSGPLNAFGVDFAAAGHIWTQELCRADSDRDGKSNGEELGDPNCHFTTAHPSNLGPATSHPGICEPVGSAGCAWQGFSC
ncbi:temptin-like [Physella acuta]|uniref:temptin-like n=1 Tax=Physella acuta TaxID=109671 RepID=UPI0027DE9CA5|nr:temptin-like [Physella acuta]